MRNQLAIAASMFALLAGSALAADAPAAANWVSLNKMVGDKVVNASGEELGEVKDIVMTRPAGHIQAVIDVEDSDRDVAVDAAKLAPRTGHKHELVLEGVSSRQQLAGMTAFDRSRSGSTATKTAAATTGTVGVRESDRPTAAPTPDRISMEKMVGRSIVSSDGHKIGDVEDVILDKTGAAKQVVIDLDWSTSDVAVDFNALHPNAKDMDQLVLSMTKQQVDGLPHVSYDADTVALKQK
jgi:sporulation protein YlmC with PRC-barrel domain